MRHSLPGWANSLAMSAGLDIGSVSTSAQAEALALLYTLRAAAASALAAQLRATEAEAVLAARVDPQSAALSSPLSPPLSPPSSLRYDGEEPHSEGVGQDLPEWEPHAPRASLPPLQQPTRPRQRVHIPTDAIEVVHRQVTFSPDAHADHERPSFTRRGESAPPPTPSSAETSSVGTASAPPAFAEPSVRRAASAPAARSSGHRSAPRLSATALCEAAVESLHAAPADVARDGTRDGADGQHRWSMRHLPHGLHPLVLDAFITAMPELLAADRVERHAPLSAKDFERHALHFGLTSHQARAS